MKKRMVSLLVAVLLTVSLFCACSGGDDYIPGDNERTPDSGDNTSDKVENPDTESLLSKVFRSEAFSTVSVPKGNFTFLAELNGFTLSASGDGYAVLSATQNGKKVQKVVTAKAGGVYLTLTDTDKITYGTPEYVENGAYVLCEKTEDGVKKTACLLPEGEIYCETAAPTMKIIPKSDGNYLYVIGNNVLATIAKDEESKEPSYREKEPTYSVHKADVSASALADTDLSAGYVTADKVVFRTVTGNRITLDAYSLPDLAPAWSTVIEMEIIPELFEGFTSGAYLAEYDRKQYNEEGPYTYENAGEKYIRHLTVVDLSTGKKTEKNADFIVEELVNPIDSLTLYGKEILGKGVGAIAKVKKIDPNAYNSLTYATDDLAVLSAGGAISYSYKLFEGQEFLPTSYDGAFWHVRGTDGTERLYDRFGKSVLVSASAASFPYGCTERSGKTYSVYGELAVDPILPANAETVADRANVCRVFSVPGENGKALYTLFGGKAVKIATSFEKVDAASLFEAGLIAVTAGGKTVLRTFDGTFLREMPAGLTAAKNLSSAGVPLALLRSADGCWYVFG